MSCHKGVQFRRCERMAILLLVFWPQLLLLLVVIGRAHSLGIARPNRLFSQFRSRTNNINKRKCASLDFGEPKEKTLPKKEDPSFFLPLCC